MLRNNIPRGIFVLLHEKDVSLNQIKRDELMDSHLMTHHPRCTTRMLREKFNIDIVYSKPQMQ